VTTPTCCSAGRTATSTGRGPSPARTPPARTNCSTTRPARRWLPCWRTKVYARRAGAATSPCWTRYPLISTRRSARSSGPSTGFGGVGIKPSTRRETARTSARGCGPRSAEGTRDRGGRRTGTRQMGDCS